MRSGFVVLGAFLLATAPAARAEEAVTPTVNIGLLSTLFREAPESLIQVMAKPFKSLMEDEAGFIGQIVVGGDADYLALKMKEGKIQLGVFQGYEFAWARLKNPELKPLLICANQQPVARSVLVVRAENKAVDYTAFEGKTLSLPRLTREHTRIYVERRCVRAGVPMDKWFAKVANPVTSNDSLDDVAGETADITAVDEVDFAAFRKEYPKTANRLRVLAESETFPSAVIAYQPGGMNEDMVKRLQAGMIAAKTTTRGRKLLDLCRITAFEAIPSNYEQHLGDILKAYPPPTGK